MTRNFLLKVVIKFIVARGAMGGNVARENLLLIHCYLSRQCWNLFSSICGVAWVMPHSVKNLLNDSTLYFVGFTAGESKTCFEGKKNYNSMVKNNSIHSVYHWHT